MAATVLEMLRSISVCLSFSRKSTDLEAFRPEDFLAGLLFADLDFTSGSSAIAVSLDVLVFFLTFISILQLLAQDEDCLLQLGLLVTEVPFHDLKLFFVVDLYLFQLVTQGRRCCAQLDDLVVALSERLLDGYLFADLQFLQLIAQYR